jgi:hypothetical protein
MSLDTVLPDIERVVEDGGLVLLKWDGERSSRRVTVIVEKPGTDFIFRKDTDDLESTVVEGIAIYWQVFSSD